MPFRLCNATATFSQLMDVTLLGMSCEVCLAYLDDVFVFSSNWLGHLESLEQVLQCIQQAWFKVNHAKWNQKGQRCPSSVMWHSPGGSGLIPPYWLPSLRWPSHRTPIMSKVFSGWWVVISAS